MNRRTVRTAAAACALGFLIFHAPQAAAACREGITLCLQALIPSLFPFFLISCLLTDSLSGRSIPLLRPVEGVSRIPAGSGSLLLTGLLGGYPAGALSVAQAYHAGRLSRADAERMLSFCSNAGPAFLFGMVAPFFDHPVHPWLLWAVQILSACIAGLLLPGEGAHTCPASVGPHLTFVQAMEKSIRSMASVCGWVVTFRMFLGLCEPVLSAFLPGHVFIALAGFLELSNGCVRLGGIGNAGLRFFIASGILSFGGICVAMQTAAVCRGLSVRRYIPGKLLQTAVSLALAAALQPVVSPGERMLLPGSVAVWVLSLVLLPPALRKTRKNKGSIPGTIGV